MSEHSSLAIFTIGHSTRSIDELVALLRAHGVRRLIDVRTIPKSRYNPEFNRESLSRMLRNRRIAYRHMKMLGGLRHARPDSINTAWRNASFRGYADYMQTPQFDDALRQLIALAGDRPAAIMCAEAAYFRCHRSLIADALVARGIDVRHITGPGAARPHKITPFAKVKGTRVTYPG